MTRLRFRIHRPSPAMSVALLALFVSLSGSSYAAVQLSKNSVVSRHIKDGEVKRADLARNAVGAAQVADGSLLTADFKAGQLKAGPQGPQGVPGPKGDAAATSLIVRSASGMGAVKADCLPGERATGGGAHSADGIVHGSGPLSHALAFFAPTPVTGGYSPSSWAAYAKNDMGADAPIIVWVVCAAP